MALSTTEVTKKNRNLPEYKIVLRIRERRKARKISPQEMADEINVPLSTYKFWEMGRSIMPYWAFIRLVKYFKIKL